MTHGQAGAPRARQEDSSPPSLKQWIWHVHSGADVSEIKSSALWAKADTLTFVSVQLAWLQEQALTGTGFFCTTGPSCTMCVHSVSSSSIHATPVHESTLQAQLLRQLPETPIVSWQLTGKLRNRWRGAPRPVLLPHAGPKYMLVEVTTLPPTPPKDHRSLHSPGPKSTAFCWSHFREPHKTMNLQHQTAPHLPAPHNT